jgi:hypothetical protein
MDTDRRQVMTLPRRAVLSLKLPVGTRIECRRGCVWLTEDGVPGDIVLEPGDCWAVSRSGGVLVQALHEAAFAVRELPLACAAPVSAEQLERLARLGGA